MPIFATKPVAVTISSPALVMAPPITVAAQLPGTSGDDVLIGTTATDSITGAAGNDIVLGGAGADRVDGGAGSDRVNGGSGNDTLVYKSLENTGSADLYNGGMGIDTLSLELDSATWFNAIFQAELSAYLAHIDAQTVPNGQAFGDAYTFDSLGLSVSQIEAVEIYVDGVRLDPEDQPAETHEDQIAAVEDGGTVTGNVLDNDIVLDLVAELELEDLPRLGSVELRADGTFVYRLSDGADVQGLAEGEVTTDQFSYRLTDADGDSATGVVTVTVTGRNDVATFVAGRLSAREDGQAKILDLSKLANDLDNGEDGTTLRYSIIEGPSLGRAVLDGYRLSFDPGADFQFLSLGQSRDLQVQVSAADALGTLSYATMTISVDGVNDKPILGSTLLRATEDGAIATLNMASLADDVDDDDTGASLTYAIVGAPAAGTASFNGKMLRFNAGQGFEDLAAGETRDVEIDVSATDRHGAVSFSTVTVRVTGANDAPILASAVLDATEDGDVARVDLATLASDPDNDPLSYTISGHPDAGTASLNGSMLRFNPGNGFQELAEGETRDVDVEVTVTDADGLKAVNVVTLRITGRNDGPTLASASLDAQEDGAVATLNLAALSSDPDGGVPSFSISKAPSEGTASLSGSTLRFNPGADFQDLALGETRDIEIEVTARDDVGAEVKTVYVVTVTGQNDAPTLQDGLLTAREDGAEVSLDLATLGKDGDSDDSGAVLTYSLLSQPNLGTARLQGRELIFDPGTAMQGLAKGETRDLKVQIAAEDSHGAQAVSIVTIRVTGQNDAPTLKSKALTAVEDGPVVALDLSDLVTDPDDATVGFTISQAPDAGLASIVGSELRFNPGNAFQDLAEGETRKVEIKVIARDADGAEGEATYAVTVTGTNDDPTLAAGLLGAVEDGGVAVLNLAALGGDADSDDTGASLTYAIVGGPEAGNARIEGTDLIFDPEDGFQDLAEGETRDLSIQILASDSHGAVASSSVTVRVTGQNDGPTIASGLRLIVSEDAPRGQLDLVAHVSDPDDTDLSFSVLSQPGSGVAGVNNGVLIYNAAPNGESLDGLAQGETRTDQVTVRVRDGQSASAETQVTLVTEGVNDAPVVDAARFTTSENGDRLFIAFSDVASDVDSDDNWETLNYGLSGLPEQGEVELDLELGGIWFDTGFDFEDLNTGDSQDVAFTLTATDRHGASGAAQITVTVEGEDEAAVPDAVFGFEILGGDFVDRVGGSVAAAGDVNGDGIADIVVGATGVGTGGGAHVIFGRDQAQGQTFPAWIQPGSVSPELAVSFVGPDGSNTGRSVSSAGDVNGDGVDDFLVSAPFADTEPGRNNGAVFVVFGRSGDDGFDAATEDLTTLDGTDGFMVAGMSNSDSTGQSVASADVNNDGLSDLLIGTPGADSAWDGVYSNGAVYVVYGSDAGFDPVIELSVAEDWNGVTYRGSDSSDYAGFSVASAGDFNGDGIEDLAIGAYGNDPELGDQPGSVFVVFGQDGGLTEGLDLETLDGTNGLRIDGVAGTSDFDSDQAGYSVASAGDVNGDGIEDLIIGAPKADPSGKTNAGAAYVVFGTDTGFDPVVDLADLDGTNGFALVGATAGDEAGISVSGAGDVNGDGIDDMLVGAHLAEGTGIAYLIFGRDTEVDGQFDAVLELDGLSGSDGFAFVGSNPDDVVGGAVSAAGDVNGDGFDDVLIGNAGYDLGTTTNVGRTIVVFGGPGLNALDIAEEGLADGRIDLSVFSAEVDAGLI